jgi:hypothetical protein
MCVLMFSVTVVCNISHSKKNSARFYNCADVFTWRTRYSCQILMKLADSERFAEICQIPWKSVQQKTSYIRQTDRRDEFNSRFRGRKKSQCLRLIDYVCNCCVHSLLLEMAEQSDSSRSHMWKIRGHGVSGLLGGWSFELFFVSLFQTDTA